MKDDKLVVAGNTSSKLSSVSKIPNPLDALRVFSDLAHDYMDLQRVREVESRKRAAIQRDIDGIKAQRDFIMSYLDKSFDERAALFRKHFELVDRALETGNIDLLKMSLATINNVAMSSPFKDIATLDQCRNLLNSDEELDL